MADKKLIWMATEVDEKIASQFDKISNKHLRSRAKHLEYIILQEIKNDK